MAEMPDVVDTDLILSSWGNQIRSRTVQRYADAAERDTEHPSPVEGDLAFLGNRGVVQVFNGSAWVDLSSPQMARRNRTAAGAQSILNDTTTKVAWAAQFEDPGWVTYSSVIAERWFQVTESGRYRVTASGLWASNNTGIRSITVHLNDSSSPASRGEMNARGTASPFVTWAGPLSAGGTFDIRVYQNSGGTLNLDEGGATWVTVERLT